MCKKFGEALHKDIEDLHMKRLLLSLIIREIQAQTTVPGLEGLKLKGPIRPRVAEAINRAGRALIRCRRSVSWYNHFKNMLSTDAGHT